MLRDNFAGSFFELRKKEIHGIRQSKQMILKQKSPLKNQKAVSFLKGKYCSKGRIRVENTIREVKIFRIMADLYRNRRKGHDLKFNIIAGIVNRKTETLMNCLVT